MAALIGAALSFAFTYLAFHGADRVAADSLVRDAVPHGFFLTFMAVLAPTLLTRKRVRTGAIKPLLDRRWRVPGPALLRALLASVIVTAATVAVTFVLLRDSSDYPFWPVMAAKTFFGSVLAAAVGAGAARAALTDGATEGVLRSRR